MADVNNSFFDRLMQLKSSLGIDSERSFAKAIGLTHGNYNSYKAGSSPSLNKLINILSSIDNLNPDWLIFGSEPMFKESKNIKVTPSETLEDSDNKLKLRREDFDFLKKQVADLTEINKNLSYIVREKNTAGTA